MILSSNLPSRILSRGSQTPVWVFVLLLAATAPLFADSTYLATNSFDGISLLPPPPGRGSMEEAGDLATVRAVFNRRTDAEKTRAMKDSGLAFSLFQPAAG